MDVKDTRAKVNLKKYYLGFDCVIQNVENLGKICTDNL